MRLFGNILEGFMQNSEFLSFKTTCSLKWIVPNLFYTLSSDSTVIFKNSCRGESLFPALSQLIKISKLVESKIARIFECLESAANFPLGLLFYGLKYLKLFLTDPTAQIRDRLSLQTQTPGSVNVFVQRDYGIGEA